MARILIVFYTESKKYFLHNNYDFDMLLRIFFRSPVDRESVIFSDSAEDPGRDAQKIKNIFADGFARKYSAREQILRRIGSYETDKGSNRKSVEPLQGSAEEVPPAQHIWLTGRGQYAGHGWG